MTRRNFLKLSALLATVVVADKLPAGKESATEKINRLLIENNGVLKGQEFVLDKPLVFDGSENVIIEHCVFTTSDLFPKDKHMIEIKNSKDMIIRYCDFNDTRVLKCLS